MLCIYCFAMQLGSALLAQDKFPYLIQTIFVGLVETILLFLLISVLFYVLNDFF